jgi:hypothetical protein
VREVYKQRYGFRTHPREAISAHLELPQQLLQLGGTLANWAKYHHNNPDAIHRHPFKS